MGEPIAPLSGEFTPHRRDTPGYHALSWGVSSNAPTHQTHDPRLSELGPAVFETDLNLPDKRAGKVRDTYTIPAHKDAFGQHVPASMLMVASDRISAFDVIMPDPIPGKGRLLTEIAAFWLRWIEDQELSPTHLIGTGTDLIPDEAFTNATTPELLEGRVTIGRLCKVIPVECIVRGYLEGSGLKDYNATGSVCGVKLPEGLTQCDKLPEPIFTPATKAESGHDENIGFDEAARHAEAFGGHTLMERLRERSLNIYEAASAYALDHGIILADTKFEFGLPLNEQGEIASHDPILIDEALTPDSSRFWPADDYKPGRAQKSFDKQYLREYLEILSKSGKWDKTPPGPSLPAEVVLGTHERYQKARDMLVGH